MLNRLSFKLILIVFFAGLILSSCRNSESAQVQPAPSPEPPVFSPSADPPATSTPPSPQATAVFTEVPPPSPTIETVPSATPSPTPNFPRYDGSPLRRDEIGVQIHIHHEDFRPIFRHLNALDVGWVKVQVSWKLYEPEPGRFAEDRLAELDALVEAANNNNMQVLLSVSKAPEWSRPTTELDGPPSDFNLYGDFMAFLAQRYRARVSAYELWNEPNLQREWNGMPLSAADLTRLITGGADGVRTADPDALIISAAPATTGINDGIAAIDDRIFLRGMLDAGIAEAVDAVGVHPYGWANPPDSTNFSPDPSVPTHNNHPSFFFADTLADYKKLLAEYGVESQLWVTEFGWGSFDQFVDDDGDPAQPPAGAEFMGDVTEWEQALYLLRALELGQQDAAIGPMMIWNLNFAPLLGSDFSESGYSILRPDGKSRAAFLTLEHAKKA